MLFNKSMNAAAHRSEHGRIPKPELPHGACTYNFHRLGIERASGVIYSSCHHVFSRSPSWCHHDSSWIRLDCDYGTFSRERMCFASCTQFAEEIESCVEWRRRQEGCMEITIECRVRMCRWGYSFRRDTLPLDRWNLMVHYAQQRYGAANLNMNLCWSDDFRKFHCKRRRRRKGKGTNERKIKWFNEQFVETPV